MCAIQELCIATTTPYDLFLQTCFENGSFIWFITIGFCYASLHFGPVVDAQEDPKIGFPLCSNPLKDLPKHLATLANKGEITYITTVDEDADDEHFLIRLLWLNKRIVDFFPPMYPITNHSQMEQWLYSVPFPSPTQSTSWIQKRGETSLIRHIESLIPKNCFEKVNEWNRSDTDSGINDLTMSYSFNVVVREKDFDTQKLDRNKPYGNADVLGISMPFVDVDEFEYDIPQPDQYSWFYAVLESLYCKKARFTGNEFQYCLKAFW